MPFAEIKALSPANSNVDEQQVAVVRKRVQAMGPRRGGVPIIPQPKPPLQAMLKKRLPADLPPPAPPIVPGLPGPYPAHAPLLLAAPSPRPHFDILHATTLGVAIVLAAIAAYFSVTGMARIFPGATLAVVVMSAVMEAGKLTGAAWLSRHGRAMRAPVRVVLTALIVALAIINAMGVFGQLSAAHLDPHVIAMSANGEQQAGNNSQIDSQQRLVNDLRRRIAQIDEAIDQANKRGRIVAAMTLIKEQGKSRDDLARQLTEAEVALTGLRTAQARISWDEKKAAADIGILEYAAALFGVDRERMIQVLILVMVLTCDPLSITLVVATARRTPKEGSQAVS